MIEFLEKIDKKDLVLVEGVKDKRILERLGFNNIIQIAGNSLQLLSEKISSLGFSSVSILTDFDNEGMKKNHLLTRLLEANDIKINTSLRKKFQHLFKIHKIEELKYFTKFMEDDYYGKTRPINNKIFNRRGVLRRRYRGKTGRHRGDIWADGRIIGSRS